MTKLSKNFFMQDAYTVAQQLIGKQICLSIDGVVKRFTITETECYIGSEDTACHAFKGKTARTQVMWQEGGVCYIYLCYGIHWMLNFVCGPKDHPEGVLIRGVEGFCGPGRVTKALGIDKTFYAKSLTQSPEIWVEDNGIVLKYKSTARIGIGYAQEKDRQALWRFVAEQ